LITDNSVTDEIFRQPPKSYYFEEPLAWKNVLEDAHIPEPPVSRFRPYNMESRGFYNISHNQNILNNVDPDNSDNEPVKEILEANHKLAEYLAEKDQLQPRRKGRPKKHDYYSEPIVTVKSLNDLVEILREQAKVVGPTLKGVRERVSIKKISKDDQSKKFPTKCTK